MLKTALNILLVISCIYSLVDSLSCYVCVSHSRSCDPNGNATVCPEKPGETWYCGKSYLEVNGMQIASRACINSVETKGLGIGCHEGNRAGLKAFSCFCNNENKCNSGNKVYGAFLIVFVTFLFLRLV